MRFAILASCPKSKPLHELSQTAPSHGRQGPRQQELGWAGVGPCGRPALSGSDLARAHVRGYQDNGGLAPGQARLFRVAFDNVPESWNQAMPQPVIAAIEFR
jgi:hypothetical protein